MRPKSELLARDDYGRRFVIFRLTEMLLANALGEVGPLESRVEQGVPGWDDLMEFWPDEDGRLNEHRWQVKRQSTPLPRTEFDELIRALATPDKDFVGHLGVPILVKVQGIGELRELLELCRRIRGDAVRPDAVDLEELLHSLHGRERRWVDAVQQAIGELLGSTSDELSALALLRRFHVEVLDDLEGLKIHAVRNLWHLFADPQAAWQNLYAYVAANSYGYVRFTVNGLQQGPLRDLARRLDSAWEKRFDLESYRATLRTFIGDSGVRVETGLRTHQGQLTLEEFGDQTSAGQGALVTGPPGCGKTLFLRALAGRLLERNAIPIWADAKLFDGHLEPWLDEAVDPLSRGAFRALSAAAAMAEQRIVFLVDGIEEAGEREGRLLLSLHTSTRCAENTLVIAIRKRPNLVPRSIAIEAEVLLPSLDAKRLIYQRVTNGRGKLQGGIDALLASLSTPFEIHLAAGAAKKLPLRPTLYQILDAYLRQRMGGDAYGPCRRLLIRAAAWMGERFATTLMPTILHRFGDLERTLACPEPVGAALQAGLLAETGGRIAFRHELFRFFFEIEDLLHRCGQDPEHLADAAEQPRYRELAELILGALDDPREANTFIRKISNADLLCRAIEGNLGYSAEWGSRHAATELLRTTHEECTSLFFPTCTNDVVGSLHAARQWSVPEKALMNAIGRSIIDEQLWEPFLEMIRTADRQWMQFSPTDGSSLQQFHSRIVQELYWNSDLSFSRIFQSVRTAQDARRISHGRASASTEDEEYNESLEERLLSILTNPQMWTPGLLLLVGILSRWHSNALREHLPAWFDTCWESKIYHVRLVAADSLLYRMPSDLEESVRSALIRRLQAIWGGFSGGLLVGPMESVMEVLVIWGVLENPSDEYISIAMSEVRDALADVETEEACAMAARVFNGQFEFFVGEAYLNAIYELNSEQQLLLLLRAAKGIPRDDASAPTAILQMLLRFRDERSVPVLTRWAQSPFPETFMAGEGAHAFVYANAGLGMLGRVDVALGPLPELPKERVWYTIGALIRHLNLPEADLSDPRFHSLWEVLQREPAWLVLDALQEVTRAWTQAETWIRGVLRDRDPVFFFSATMCEIAVRALESGIPDHSPALLGNVFEPVSYALWLLEEHGDASCVMVIERMIDNPVWGGMAINALRAIRERSLQP